MLAPPAQAREPDWNYSSPDSVIGGIAVSSSGDLIAATNDKVLFFTHTGSLLGKEPFGSTLVMTPDGKYTASEYSAFIDFFKNPRPAGTTDEQKATKAWEYESRQKTRSLSISNDSNGLLPRPQRCLNLRHRPARQENTDDVDSVVRISPDGELLSEYPDCATHTAKKVYHPTSSLITLSALR
jgi:hypothetical protein